MKIMWKAEEKIKTKQRNEKKIMKLGNKERKEVSVNHEIVMKETYQWKIISI